MRKAVFLDRDGVLNKALIAQDLTQGLAQGRPWSPRTLADFHIYETAAPALAALKSAGYLLIVVTNQPDFAPKPIGAGLDPAVLSAMHHHLASHLPIDEIRVALDRTYQGGRLYKPAPGLLIEAAIAHGLDLDSSFMIGDRWRDIACGKRAGCYTILIDRAYDEPLTAVPDARCGDIAEAAALILGKARPHSVVAEGCRHVA